LILDITVILVLQQPAQSVYKLTQEQLMQFIRLQKLINIAARVLSERVLDWLNTKSVPIVDTNFGQKL